jgi:hypothetical protein
MIPVIVKLCESPSRAGGLLIRNYCNLSVVEGSYFGVLIYLGFRTFL